MPGIFGCINRQGSRLPVVLTKAMEKSMKYESWYKSRISYNDSSFIGVVDLDTFFENNKLTEELNDNICVAIGNVYNKRNMGHTISDVFLDLYNRNNPDSLIDSIRQLNGSFAFAIYDKYAKKMIIGNDRYGSKNVFYKVKKDNLIFSSEIKAIIEEPSVDSKLNKEAIGEFFTFSYLLGNKTFFEGIELLPPASILFYNSDTDKVQVRKYWDFVFFKRKESKKSLNYHLKIFDKVMERAVENRMKDEDKIGIFLSGGLDSRLIAGFAKRVADRINKELISFTFGTGGGWQKKIARQISDKLGIENRFYKISSDSIAKYADEIVYKGEGLIRIRDAHFISLLNIVRQEVDTILVGLFGSELFGEILSKHILDVSNSNELITYLFDKYEIKQNTKHIPKLFLKNSHNDLREKAKKNFMETVKKIPLHHYAEIAAYWEFRQRSRRYIIPLSNYLGWYLDTRLPYLDNEIVEFSINLPLELRIDKKFIHIASKRLFPSLAEIPWEKSGVPPDTEGLRLLSSIMRRSVERNTKRYIERISGGKILFKPVDYRGYNYWLRTSSKNYAEDLLLRNSYEGVFNRQYVKKIINEHMNGKNNHDQIICDIINIFLLKKKFFTMV